MAPIHVIRLFEIYCYPTKQSCPHVMRHEGVCTPMKDLQDLGMIDIDSETRLGAGYHGWKITEKGVAYVQAMMRVPLPEMVWVVPEQA